MGKLKLIIAAGLVLVIAAGVSFYYVVNHREDADFKEGIVVPDGIAIFEKEIYDQVVAKTLVLEIQKSPLEKATMQDLKSIDDEDRAFSIQALYNAEAAAGKLGAIEILKDGSFVASKSIDGRTQYVKGRFGKYTLDYLTGLYTLE